MKYLFHFLFAVVFSSSLTAEAHWSAVAMSKLKEINEKYKELREGEMVTAWGGWKRMNNLFPLSLKGQIVSTKTLEMRSGEVSFYMFRRLADNPAPLVIFFPGIFGQPGDRMTDDFIHKLEKLDIHLAVVPNFLSESWVRSMPIYDRHPAKTEVMNIEAIWKEILKNVPLTQISRVHVIGESLGSLFATAWVAQNIDPIHTLTLLWPPGELDRALENLDNYVDTNVQNTCADWLTFPLFLAYFVFPPTPDGISESHAKCLASWGAQKGFVKGLHKVSGILSDMNDTRPMRPKNFRQFFEGQHQIFWNIIEAKGHMLHLGFWLTNLRKHRPQVEVKIVSSYDDFLNKGLPIVEVARKSGVDSESVYIFDWGGHGGPVSTPEFMEILQHEIFPQTP